MKLRNKNTGEIVELSDEEYDAYKIFGKLTDCAKIWVEYNPMKKVYENVKVVFDEESSYLYIYKDGKQVGLFYVNEED